MTKETNYTEARWKNEVNLANLSTLMLEHDHLEVIIKNNEPDEADFTEDTRSDNKSITNWFEKPQHFIQSEPHTVIFKGDDNFSIHYASATKHPKFSTPTRESNFHTASNRLDIVNKLISQKTDVTSVL